MSNGSDTEKRPTTLQTVERALAFLEVIAQAPRQPGVKEVAAALGLNITTCYHLLNTLQRAGYVNRDGDGTLRVGSRVGLLYQGLVRQFVLGRDLRPVVEALAVETGETSYLAGLGKEGVAIQALVEGDRAVRVTGLYLGFSGFEHIRAAGKAVLAYLGDEQRDALLARNLAPDAVAARQAVLAELATVRERGWALDEGDYQEGVCCVAAPFFMPDGAVAGSITVSTPAARFASSREALTGSAVEAGRRASEQLGHHPGTRSVAG